MTQLHDNIVGIDSAVFMEPTDMESFWSYRCF